MIAHPCNRPGARLSAPCSRCWTHSRSGPTGHRGVHWLHNGRYLDSGQFISWAGVTSGVDASLYTRGRFVGGELAEQTAQAMGYPHTRFLADPTWLVPADTILQTALVVI